MGVYYGLLMFAIGFWFHASTIKHNESLPEAEKENAFKWFGIGAVSFMAGVVAGYAFNWAFVMGILGGMAVGVGGEFGEASGGDTGAQGIILELIPPLFGLALVYLVRMKFLLKKSLGFSEVISKFKSSK